MANRIDVFISSTSRDLQKYRAKVQEIIWRLGAFPIAMEVFDATERNALQLCYDELKKAEIFIGIYAHRYGFIPPPHMTCTLADGRIVQGDNAKSITEWEYEWAIEQKIPMLLYVVADQDDEGNPLLWQPDFIDPDPQKTRLNTFKQHIMGNHVVGFFYSPDHLAVQLQSALFKLMTDLMPQESPRHDFYAHYPLPTNYIPRSDVLTPLAIALKDGQNVAIHGMGGIGKSVIARALCDEESLQTTFPDGILWATLGSHPTENDFLQKLREWIQALGGQINVNAPTLDTLRALLGELLKEKACLLVLDDIWQKKHAEIFRVAGEKCQLLMTTRDAETARALGMVIHTIPTLSPLQSQALLKEWAQGALDALSPERLEVIVTRLGRLPLAIKLAGAQLQKKSPDTWLETFDARKLKSRRAEAIHDSLEQTFALSLDALNLETRSLYVALAIFREDENVPFVAIARLWQGIANIDADDAQDLLEDLIARALCEQVPTEQNTPYIRLHDLLRDFMRDEIPDSASTHRALLSAYKPDKNQAWHTLSDDGYLYDHLVFHLQEAEENHAIELLFNTDSWFHQRVQQSAYLYEGYIADLTTAWQSIAHPQAMAQINEHKPPTALVRCIRYALIRTSLNSIAGNYEPSLVVQALQTRLEGWTTTRALSITRKITHLERRVSMCASLIDSGLLSPEEAQTAKKIALNALSVINDKGSWSSTLTQFAPHLTPEEATQFAQDSRLEGISNANLVALLPYLTESVREILIDERLNLSQSQKTLASFFSRDYTVFLLEIPPYLSASQRQSYLNQLEKGAFALTEFNLEGVLASLYPALTDVQRTQAIRIANRMTNEKIRTRTLEWLHSEAPPERDPAEPIAPTRPENLKEAIRATLKITDERLVNRALHNLEHPSSDWLPLKPAFPVQKTPEQISETLADYSEEMQAKLIVEMVSKLSDEYRQKTLAHAQTISDDWYRAIALSAHLPFLEETDAIIRNIQRAVLLFMTKRTTRQREYLLHFLATHTLFKPPVLDISLTEAIIATIKEISEQWEWM